MTIRNFVLGGAASIAVTGMMLAAPVNAQNLPRYSTPAEQIQTDALNAQQAAEPGIVVAANPSDDAAYQAALAQHNAEIAQHNNAQAQYNTQLQDYQQKNSAYDAQKKDYEDRAEAYANQSDRFQDQVGEYNDPPPPVVIANDPPPVVVEREHVLVYPDHNDGLVSLNELSNPDDELQGAPVQDRAGRTVGHFRHMTFQDQDIPKALITLHNNKTVAVREDHLRFDTDHDTVVADLSFDELNDMPARF